MPEPTRHEIGRQAAADQVRPVRAPQIMKAQTEAELACPRGKHARHRVRIARPRRDLAIKVKIFEFHNDGYGADEIVRDVRRLIVMPDEMLASILARQDGAFRLVPISQ
jgi:hypothetical protein